MKVKLHFIVEISEQAKNSSPSLPIPVCVVLTTLEAARLKRLNPAIETLYHVSGTLGVELCYHRQALWDMGFDFVVEQVDDEIERQLGKRSVFKRVIAAIQGAS